MIHFLNFISLDYKNRGKYIACILKVRKIKGYGGICHVVPLSKSKQVETKMKLMLHVEIVAHYLVDPTKNTIL